MLVTALVLIFFAAHTQHAMAQSSSDKPSTGPGWLRGEYLNTVLSVHHVAEMREFYGGVLGLESLPDIDLPARVGRPFDTIMIRFRVGRSVVKMIPHENLERLPGGHAQAAGLRLLSLPVEDGEAVAARLEDRLGTRPSWEHEREYRVAWVRDPDDNEVELRWYPDNVEGSRLSQMELGITTNDLEAARRHYGTWLSLTPLPAVELKGFPGVTHRYQVGDSVLRLWSPENRLPADTGFTMEGYGLRYVQFIVRDAYALHDELKLAGAAIAQEPTPLGTAAVLLFAADPDGVINECVGPAKK